MMVGMMSQLILKHTVLLTVTFKYGPTGLLMVIVSSIMTVILHILP